MTTRDFSRNEASSFEEGAAPSEDNSTCVFVSLGAVAVAVVVGVVLAIVCCCKGGSHEDAVVVQVGRFWAAGGPRDMWGVMLTMLCGCASCYRVVLVQLSSQYVDHDAAKGNTFWKIFPDDHMCEICDGRQRGALQCHFYP